MAHLKRQRSWHEDFARNFFKLFSRSKSLEPEKTEPEPENGEEHKEDSPAGQSDEADSLPTPEPQLTTEPEAQALEHSEQDRLVEADSVCDPEGSVQGDVERDPPPVTPPAPEPQSPAIPVDGFFRRLGSLFLFGRAEPGGADRQSQSGTESEVQGAEDAQHTDPETVPTGEREAQTSVEGEEQPQKPLELSRSVAGPEVKATLHPEQDIQDAQLQEEAEEDGEGPVESPSSDEEQERRRALACPPVVTHVTYRGLREIRKMRRKQEVRLHSPISEGEEVQRRTSAGLSASEDEESQQHAASPGSPCVAVSTESQAVQPYTETSSSTDIVRPDYQSHFAPRSSNTLSSTHIPVEAEGTDSALSQSALQTHPVARTQPAGLESDPALATGTSSPGESDPSRLAVCLEVETGSETHVDELEASVSELAPLGIVSDQETQAQSVFRSVDALRSPLTAQALEAPHTQLSDAATATNTVLTDINTASNSHTCVTGSDFASNCFQESQLSGSRVDGQDPEDNQAFGSSKAEISEHTAWKDELVLEEGATQLGLAEEQSGLAEEMLQLESRKMVDDILKNALAALERIDGSERGSETPLSDELNEGAETLMLMGARDSVGGSASLEQIFLERSTVQADGNPQLNLSDDTLGGRVQIDGSRSTPSSGYESIAGSDTDIRSMAMSADISLSSGTISTRCTDPEFREKPGIGCCTEERELYMVGSPICQNSGQTSVHSTLLLPMNLEVKEGPGGTVANNEQLFQYNLGDNNVSHKTNFTSAQTAISESLSGINKGEVRCAVEELGVHVCVTQRENDDTGPNNPAKANTESNNHGHALNLDSGDASLVINNVDKNQVQSISKGLSPSGMQNLDSKQLSQVFEIRDFSEKEDSQTKPVRQSHAADETTAAHPVNSEAELGQSGHTQGLSNCTSDKELSFALVKTYLATVIEDGPSAEMEIGETASGPGLTQSVNLDSSYDFTSSCSAVKVVICDDQSQDHEPAGPSHQSSGRLASLPVSVRAHLDIPGTSSRPQAADLHQGPRGFTIISEEEELDTVFVNDTGPMLSPSTRRAKAYPFSLSPIFEEDSGREDTSREDALHVPPATEEEQRSVEQQASSVLSLLQSVSERLQSSAFSGSEDSEERVEEPEHPQRFLRPLWERCDDDNGTTDEESSFLLQQQLTGKRLYSDESEPTTEECASPSFIQDQRTTSGVQDGDSESKHHTTTLNNANNVIKTANTPFYQYLKSSIMPSLDTEKQGTESALCYKEGRPITTTLTETGSFGKVCPRPTLLHIYEGTVLSGNRRDVCGDVEDASLVLFLQEALVQARRGCWLLYVEPGYRGSCIVLEEGQTVQTRGGTTESDRLSAPTSLSIGSIRRAVKDDSVPEIHLPSIRTQESEPVCLHSEADHIDQHGPVHISDLTVRYGCWLAYDGAGFTGNHTVLEAGGLTTPVLQNSPISCVRSLRPVRMGGLRVRRPLDLKMVLYEKPLFQGQCQELLENMPSLGAKEGLSQVSSLRVTGGVWVGYSSENYRGQQCMLEEGEYSDCSAFFSEPPLTLRSCRFLQADFIEPEVSLKSSGEQIELVDQDVANLQQNGLAQGVDAILVKSGVWVAYSGRCYTGEQFVLEKGQHPGTLDWGGRQSSPLSIRPVRRELCGEEEPKFLLRTYSKPCFAGESREFESEEADCGLLSPTSFRVITGSWLLFEEEGYCGNQFVLGEGLYPDLISCGCLASTIRSFKPIPYSFSEPSISFFSLSSFEGLETVADSPMETMNDFFTQSLRVNSGLWVVYEFSQFKGRQMLLQTGEYPCWGEYSSWETIGSLHPLRQRRMYMQVRSRALGTALTAERTRDPSSLAKLSLRPADRSLDTQHWIYSQALFKSKVGKGCLSVIGGKACVGARVALWEEHGRIHQRWSLNENGTISPHLDRSLVLDRRGGNGIDRDHLILSEFCADNTTQYWDIEVL